MVSFMVTKLIMPFKHSMWQAARRIETNAINSRKKRTSVEIKLEVVAQPGYRENA